jgi:hypothetical protein
MNQTILAQALRPSGDEAAEFGANVCLTHRGDTAGRGRWPVA